MIFILIYSFLFTFCLGAEVMTLAEVETRFENQNLELVAQRFDVEAARAQVMTERTWSNPNFAIQEALNPLFDWDSSEINHQFQLSQTVVLGKRGKRVQAARLEVQKTKLDYEDRLHSLKLELRTSFLTLYHLNLNKSFYEKSLESLQKTVQSAERLAEKHLILLSEVMRLKAVQLTLETEHLELMHQISEEQSKLSILLGEKSDLQPSFEAKALFQAQVPEDLDALLKMAEADRVDFKLSSIAVEQEKLNLSLQKSLWVPDLNIQLSYQQAGNSVPNYFGLQLGFDVPLLNQGLGPVRQAKNALEAKKKRESQTLLKLKQEVWVAFQKARSSQDLLSRIDPTYLENYDKLVVDMTLNYQRGNVSIMAFADFYESYRDSVIQMNQTLLNCAISFVELNYVVERDVVKI